MLKIIKAVYKDSYTIIVNFNNNIVKEIDLSDELYGEIFEPLKDKDFFKNYYLDCNTICWPNGADFAPEYLLEKGKDVTEKVHP